MFIVDAHQDIAYNYFEHGRDFLRSVQEKRKRESTFDKMRGIATLGLANALRGRVGLVFGTLYIDPAWSPFASKVVYENPQEAHDGALRQLAYYVALAERDERIKIIRTQQNLAAFEATLSYSEDDGLNQMGIVILMEGADPIREPGEVVDWYGHGVRIIGPAWSETRYAGGTGRPGPLTPLGFELLGNMQELNMLLDLSHLAEEAYFQAIEKYEGSMIASHSNPRAYVESDRMLSDDMIRVLAERDGVIGLVAYNRFIQKGWKKGDPKSKVTVEDYVNMIDYICQMLGNARHVGIGTDWDGGFGSESIPDPFDSIQDLIQLEDVFKNRGYSEQDIAGMLRQNFLRKLNEVLPSA